MAKKFNLAELMGETVSNLNTENAKEQEIPLADIEENAANIYAQTDIEELAESIKVAGLMQPLVVWPKPDGGYLLLAGHRRRNAIEQLGWNTAPCRVLDKNFDPALRTLVLHWTNTMVRGGGGLTAPYIAQAAKEIEEALKDLQARGVVELPGKLRSYIADVLDKNESAVQRAQYIDKHLDRQWKEKLCRKSIKESIADEIAHCEPGLQADLYRVYNDKLFSLDARKVKAHRKAAEFDFAPLTCPEASPCIEPCSGADKRAAWVKDGHCEGCCHECSLAASCDRVCGKVKQRLKNEQEKAEREENHEQQIAAFNASPLAKARRNIRFALACKDIRNVDDLPEARHQWYMSWLWSTDPLAYHAPDLSNLFEVAQALEIDPFEMICGRENGSVWREYTEEKPPEGARVLCKLCGCANRYGEYVYRGGKWFFPDLDDEACEANILVSAWTEVYPE
ncbi:MAG: ParB/RepB/Spo0J family partition protein [Agathobaculum butyriciproducens]|nr:ParB/RepB/Spo0J family partition protein [Agathobaculum butyriciproducens]